MLYTVMSMETKRSGHRHQYYNTLHHDISSFIIITKGRKSHVEQIKQSNNMYIIKKVVFIGMLSKCRHAYRYRTMFQWKSVCKVTLQMMCKKILKSQPEWMKLDPSSSYLVHSIIQVQVYPCEYLICIRTWKDIICLLANDVSC